MRAISLLGVSTAIVLLISPIYARTVDLTDANFDDEVAKQPSFVMFFAPWCGHCKRAKPDWEQMAESFAKYNDILIGSVDCDEHKNVASKYEIKGFPTIKYFKGNGEKPIDYEGGRSTEDFVEFVNQQTGLNVKVKKPLDPVRELDSDSFKADVESLKKNYFVIFHASWCGHCKTLMPKLPQLVSALNGDDTIEVVKIDANKYSEAGSKYDIQGYPTLKLFLADEEKTIIPYESAREPQDMLNFVNKHVGTHRTIDGGFTTDAWPADEIKDLVDQFRKADKTTEKETIVEKAKEAAKGAVGRFAKFAHFYPKLMKKAMDKPQFLTTEPERLQKLLQNPMGDEPKLNALYRLTILKQLQGVNEPSGEDDLKDEL